MFSAHSITLLYLSPYNQSLSSFFLSLTFCSSISLSLSYSLSPLLSLLFTLSLSPSFSFPLLLYSFYLYNFYVDDFRFCSFIFQKKISRQFSPFKLTLSHKIAYVYPIAASHYSFNLCSHCFWMRFWKVNWTNKNKIWKNDRINKRQEANVE